MAKDWAKWLYSSKAFRDLAYKLKVEKGQCSRCKTKFIGKEVTRLIAHHKIELTEDNISNPKIALNPELIEIVCQTCHNKHHIPNNRKIEKRVYIIYGSPLSGKTTYVKENINNNDIVVDIDSIWQALTYKPRYYKPDKLKYNIFDVYNYVIDKIKMRYGDWESAYVVGGFANAIERQRLANQLGAELIYIESTKEECLAKIEERPKEWIDYIEKWWSEYEQMQIPPSCHDFPYS